MTPERWSQIKELLQAALECEPVKRDDFLTQACAGDQQLRNELESLLAIQEHAKGFLEMPAFEVAAPLLADEQSASIIGQQFGPYKILSQLGKGGMGEVYLADDDRLNRRVALKLLPSYITSDEGLVRRFKREAHVISALNHPNIITIHEIGHGGGIDFIVTEYIDGETLRQRMSAGRMPVGEVLDIAIQVAAALAAAHKAGIVHRDIKPDNVMVRGDGLVKVLDFGIAKLAEPFFRQASGDGRETVKAPTQTEPGLIIGTPKYMSPEQAQGLRVDARTDVWSLGVVLHEMVSGRVPFEGANHGQVIAGILAKEPPPLSQLLPEAPAELERIVTKALRKDREERFQTVQEMLDDLRTLKRDLELENQQKGSGARDVGDNFSGRAHFSAWSNLSKVGVLAMAVLTVAVGVVLIPNRNGSETDHRAVVPSPTVVTSAADPATLKQEVNDALQRWVTAFREHDLDTHLSFYADSLETYNRESGVNISQVRSDRRRDIEDYETLDVELSKISISIDPSGGRAISIFDRTWNYTGVKHFSGMERQELLWAKTVAGWRITGEKTLQEYYEYSDQKN